jgi:transposase
MSYVGTAHKHGFNTYETIKNAFSGNPEFIFG